MTVHHFRVIRHQELAANREARVVVGFRNTGLLQQFQRSATGPDKDELRLDHVLGFIVFQIGNGHAPAVIRVTLKAAHFGADLQFEVVFLLQCAHQLTGDFTVVYVGPDFSTGRGHFLVRVTPFHHQRRPLFDLRMIFGIFHATEQAALLQRGVARAQEVNVVVAPHKAHVRNGINKGVRVVHHTAVYLMRPELAGDLEGFVDLNRLLDTNGTVLFLRRIVQFHECRVARTGVVPAVRTLLRHAVEALNHGHRPVWL
ncbi:hypothetical protein D3C72_806250 [compost metagenome]